MHADDTHTGGSMPLFSFLATLALSAGSADAQIPNGPVIFYNTADDVSSAEYSEVYQHWTSLGYTPTTVSGVASAGSTTRFNGIFAKDPNVEQFQIWRNMSYSQYYSKWNTYVNQGYRVLDIDAHNDGGDPAFHAIWVKEADQPNFKSHAWLRKESLVAQLEKYDDLGYRPRKINGWPYNGGTRFSAVWEAAEHSWKWAVGMTSAEYSAYFTEFTDAGYIPVEIAAYHDNGLKFAGVWVQDPSIYAYQAYRGMTADQLLEKQVAYKKQNFVQIDLDAYYLTEGDSMPVYSGVWVRRQPRDQLTSSIGLTSSLAALSTTLDDFSGAIGFVVENLQTGDYVAYNPHEPFYAASTNKVQIAAAALVEVDDGVMGANVSWPFLPHFYMGDSDALTTGDFGTWMTMETYMSKMINSSSNAATDQFEFMMGYYQTPMWWLPDLMRSIGRERINETVLDRFGMKDIGEVTGICERNKRMLERVDRCFRDIPCSTLQVWWRDGDSIDGLGYGDCVDSWTDLTGDEKDAYRALEFHNLDNSTSPAENARFWRDLTDGLLLSDASTNQLIDILDATGNGYPVTGFDWTLVDRGGGKYGNKADTRSWVGLFWDFGPSGTNDNAAFQYSVSIYTEGWDSADESRDTINEVVRTAIEALDAAR
jgi:hypothetical protein